MKIRRYQDADKLEVIQLWDDCGLIVAHNDPTKDIARKCKHNPEWFFVGEFKQKVIASCMVGYEGHRGWIHYFAVSPAYQGRGYARELIEHTEEVMVAAGCSKINLQIRASNQKVIEFYRHLEYQIDNSISMGKRLDYD